MTTTEKIKKLNSNVIFLNSYNFMLAPQAKLVDNLPYQTFSAGESF